MTIAIPLPRLDLPLVIDSTMLTTADACLRRFYYEFAAGLTAGRKSVHLHAGGCFARAMEVFYTRYYVHGDSFQVALDRAEIEYHLMWGNWEPETEKEADSPKTRERTFEAVIDYFREYPPDTDPIRPFILNGKPTVEFTFGVPLDPSEGWPLHPSGDPFLLGGRFDLLGEMGKIIVIRDEKTMQATPGQHWAPGFLMRGQFLGYVWACRKLGIPVSTVVVRGVVILKTMLKQIPVTKTYPDQMILKWEERTKKLLWRIREAYDSGEWDYSMGDACSSFGGCPFVDPCVSEDPSRWFSTYRRRIWNPILKNPEVMLEAA